MTVATLRQLVIFIVDKVFKSVTLQALGPGARDDSMTRMGLSFPNLLDNGERLKFSYSPCVCLYDIISRVDRERAHELSPTLPQGASLFPSTHPRPVCNRLSSSNHSHVHSVPITLITTPLLLHALQNTPSAPLSCLSSAACVVFLFLEQAILLQTRDG